MLEVRARALLVASALVLVSLVPPTQGAQGARVRVVEPRCPGTRVVQSVPNPGVHFCIEWFQFQKRYGSQTHSRRLKPLHDLTVGKQVYLVLGWTLRETDGGQYVYTADVQNVLWALKFYYQSDPARWAPNPSGSVTTYGTRVTPTSAGTFHLIGEFSYSVPAVPYVHPASNVEVEQRDLTVTVHPAPQPPSLAFTGLQTLNASGTPQHVFGPGRTALVKVSWMVNNYRGPVSITVHKKFDVLGKLGWTHLGTSFETVPAVNGLGGYTFSLTTPSGAKALRVTVRLSIGGRFSPLRQTTINIR